MKHITETDLNGIPLVAGQAANEILEWNGANWVNGAPAARIPTLGGTLNYVTKFTPDGFTIDDSQIFDNATYVGVNNATPDTKFDISETNNTTANSGVLKLRNTGSGVNYTETAILFNSSLNGNADFLTGRIYAKYDSMSASDCRITLQSLDNTNTPVDTLSVKNKSVGVGINTPVSRLHVKGLTNANTDFGLKVENLAGAVSLQVRDDGSVYNLGGGSISGNLAFGELALIGNNSGTGGNVALGYSTLNANTTGEFAVAIGYNALKTNTTGVWNIAIGYETLKANNSDANVAIGHRALTGNTTGYYNHAIGRDALLYNTTGFENTAIGYRCLYNNADGDDNIAIGYQALLSNVSGNENIAIGYRALETSTGTGSVALGLDAGRAVGSSAGGVFLGYGAGRFETGANKLFIDNNSRVNEADGRVKALIYGIFDAAVANQRLTINGNVGIQGTQAASTSLTVNGLGSTSATFGLKVQNSSGALSLQVRDDGSVYNLGSGSVSTNAAYGELALLNNVSGDHLSAFGYEALRLTTGASNSAFGYQAGVNTSTGTRNSFFGAGAGAANTTGIQNVFIGGGAGGTSVGNDNSTFVGYNCGSGINSSNTAFGYLAMGGATTGGVNNVAIGPGVMYSITSATLNTGLGYNSFGNLTSGNQNVGLGYEAGRYNTTQYFKEW